MYWLNEASRKFLSEGYLSEGETPEGRIKDIADSAERILGIEGFSNKFYSYMEQGFYSLSSPVWANFGKERGCPISCFGSFCGDSVVDIMDCSAEVGVQTKLGGGTSAYFGDVRCIGSPISGGGKSDGVLPFLRIFETVVGVCKQTEIRRGSFAAYLPIDHGDIKEFLKIKQPKFPVQHIFPAVTVSDEWMNSMIEGDVEKREIWAQVLKSRNETGVPYILFSDNVNNNKPECYKDKEIYSSNLCVSGDTLVLTEGGEFRIDSLAGQEVNVYNGWKFTKALAAKTNDSAKLFRVKLKSGEHLDCTEYHKFYDSYNKEVRCGDLVANQRLLSWKHPISKKNIYHSVESVTEIGYGPTYCVNEPQRNIAVFNGILTGNCNEIALPVTEDESFVCCLSSINLAKWDDVVKTDAIETLTMFLDAVMTEFIDKAKSIKFMERSVRFAERHRALGIGILGWHSYLQDNLIPFESMQAKLLNSEIAKIMKDRTYAASSKLAELFGECEVTKGTGRRNATTMANAPTTSSSFILGQISQSFEPFRSNYYVKDLAKGLFTFKNPKLEEVLESLGMNNDETWESIRDNDGSVQHLDLPDSLKEVFKTFGEISQMEIVIQAAQRQKYIDQGQSLNLLFDPNTPTKEVNKVVIRAWELGVKGLYYQHSYNASRKFGQKLQNMTICKNCEG